MVVAWLPIAVALASSTATFVLYFALDAKQNAQIAHVVQAGAESAKSQIAIRMEARLRSLIRMATRWETPDRVDRINELLEKQIAEKRLLTPDDFRRIQTDIYAAHHRKIAQAVAAALFAG